RRMDPLHLRQRLGVESEGKHPLFGQGRGFRLPKWLSLEHALTWGLKATLLYEVGRRNALRIGVTHNEIPLQRLPSAFEGFTILQISDPHLDANERFPEALANAVAGLDYDICVITGDFRVRTNGSWHPAMTGVATLREQLQQPVYAVLGNHDSIHMLPELEALDIQVLLNESVVLRRGDDKLYLGGVDD